MSAYTQRATDLLNRGRLPDCGHGTKWIEHGWKFCPGCLEVILARADTARSGQPCSACRHHRPGGGSVVCDVYGHVVDPDATEPCDHFAAPEAA